MYDLQIIDAASSVSSNQNSPSVRILIQLYLVYKPLRAKRLSVVVTFSLHVEKMYAITLCCDSTLNSKFLQIFHGITYDSSAQFGK